MALAKYKNYEVFKAEASPENPCALCLDQLRILVQAFQSGKEANYEIRFNKFLMCIIVAP